MVFLFCVECDPWATTPHLSFQAHWALSFYSHRSRRFPQMRCVPHAKESVRIGEITSRSVGGASPCHFFLNTNLANLTNADMWNAFGVSFRFYCKDNNYNRNKERLHPKISCFLRAPCFSSTPFRYLSSVNRLRSWPHGWLVFFDKNTPHGICVELSMLKSKCFDHYF